MFGLWRGKGRERRPRYIRAAHYFGDGWPLDSLMVMRQPQLRHDLETLRSDGFNTIIVVVPWRGFQASQNPPAYDAFYQSQLRCVLAQAQALDLAVILRVAYTHQVLPGPAGNGIHQAQLLLTRAPIREAWLDYHGVLAAIAQDYPACIGAFVSWEELWHAFANWQTLPPDERQRFADASGYTAFLRERDQAAAGRIPERESPDYVHYHAFLNQRMAELFGQARERFPMLGVEGRVDRDPLYGGGAVQWLDNERYYDLEPARYAYWAPFFGAENQGEAVDVPAALSSLESMLRGNSRDGELTGQIVEQFNFIDDTARYADVHARIHREGIGEFLAGAAALLRRYSGGYGLWAHRSYRANVLYNAAFLDGGRGWSGAGLRFLAEGGAALQPGLVLTQQLRPKVAGIPRANRLRELTLRVVLGGSSTRLRARINGGAWTLLDLESEHPGEAAIALDFDSIFTQGLCFELEVLAGQSVLQRLFLFSHIYSGGVRNPDGGADVYLDDVRRLNERLS